MVKGTQCESITLYTHVGEDENGVAQYQVMRMDGVAVFHRRGVKARGNTEGSGDRAVLYVFPRAIRLKADYVDEDVFDEMVERDGCFTVHTDGRDRVYLGLCWDAVPPGGSKVVRPVEVKYNDRGRRGLTHLKVRCV